MAREAGQWHIGANAWAMACHQVTRKWYVRDGSKVPRSLNCPGVLSIQAVDTQAET